jgi:imidazolonepropionase-like amidohydrolase
MEAIVSATATAARLVQLDGELGTIEVGKRADVLCISGDPLREIRNLADTVLVLKDGVVMVEHGRLVDTEVVRDLWPLPPGPVPT